MKIRCPSCGATTSLDALIAHDDAREALKLLVNVFMVQSFHSFCYFILILL